MKRLVAFACCVGLTMPGMATVSPTDKSAMSATRVATADQGYCRTPAPLPDLGPEIAPQQAVPRSGRVVSEASSGSAPPPPPPPPVPMLSPPPASVDMAGGDADTIVVTGSRVATESFESAAPVSVVSADTSGSADSSETRSMPGPVPPRPPSPRPQAGLLTAGEHDDLLNPELYDEYRRQANLGQQARGLPVVDTARLLTVELRDRRGRAVPFADVELRCSDGNSIKLKTVADGQAVFFPELDRLSEEIWVRAGGSDWRSVRLSSDPGAQKITITQREAAPRVQKLDLALVIDVTGSMSDELNYLQAEITSIVGSIKQRHPDLDVRVAFTFYRDQGDDFVTQTFGFDGDIIRAQARLAAQEANGGGDYEEAMQDAMVRAAQLEWRDDAVKSLLLVADAPPHTADIARTWLAAEHLRAERVHIVPVGASGVGDMAKYVMRAMAAATQSRYTFLTDDSGIGNPHAPPAIDCYLVTRLDHLLRRVIDSQLSGRRIEPESSEIIRSVGEYDAGRCVLPADFVSQNSPKGSADKGEQER